MWSMTQNRHGAFGRFEFEGELLFKRGEDGWAGGVRSENET